jgi:16S rRNA processing protein RimM
LTDRTPSDREPRFLIIGRVAKPWSYRGELKIEILTDFPERFASLQTVYLGDDAKPFSVERARLHGNAALLKLKGVDSTEAGNRLRDLLVRIPTSDAVPLPRGQYYLYQLVGLAVRTVQGETLGRVVDILDTAGANDVYVVQDGKREILIPAIEPVVKQVDLDRGEIVVELLEGLIP